MPKFDELNQLKRFFSTMELSEDEKKKRCDFAYSLYEAIYYSFTFLKVESEVKAKNITKNELENRLKDAYKQENISKTPEYVKKMTDSILKPNFDLRNITDKRESEVVEEVLRELKTETFDAETIRDSLIDRLTYIFEDVPHEPDYIPRLVDEIIDTTNRHPNEDYYLSKDRALLIAQNESNSAYNYVDYENAVNSGKQYKVWYAELDNRTRDAHAEIDGITIPIDELFHVGNDDMRYPHDYNASPQNIINCRCVCRYE